MSQAVFSGPRTVPTRMDFSQAVTGVLLILFVWAHLFMVGSVVISPKIMNALGWFFEATYMAQIGGPLIFLLMLAHFVIAARKMPFHAGELRAFWRHSAMLRHKDTWMWLVQVVTAVIVLVMGSIHMYEVLTTLPITAESSAARVRGGWLPFYLVLLPAAELHVGIGFYRLGVKYGLITRANRSAWQWRENLLMIGFIVFGLATLLRLWLLAA